MHRIAGLVVVVVSVQRTPQAIAQSFAHIPAVRQPRLGLAVTVAVTIRTLPRATGRTATHSAQRSSFGETVRNDEEKADALWRI
jgi:hypothetical protein